MSKDAPGKGGPDEMNDTARYVIAIAEEGSVSAAARRIGISQSALSQRLGSLERRLGAELFDRQSARLAPTLAGQVYLRWARDAVRAEDQALRKIAAVTNHGYRRLQVGTSLPRGSGMLLDVAERFQREVTGCTLFFSEAGMPETHRSQLESNEIDCALLTPVSPRSPAIRSEVLCRERMLVLARKDDDLGARDVGGPYPAIPPEALRDRRFVMPPHNLRHNQVIRSLMDAADIHIEIALHGCNNEMNLALVRRGMGVTMIPNTFTYGWDLTGISLYEVEGFPCYGDLYYNRRVDTERSEDEAAFVSMLRDWLSAHPELGVDG